MHRTVLRRTARSALAATTKVAYCPSALLAGDAHAHVVAFLQTAARRNYATAKPGE
jgi:hypothetical protein